ncbi:MAG: flagellar motor switch protein FliN [Rhodospirillales bacterium]|jgi:flagellar motor switch protein FliN/FliY|nr:flagellar motor switch protein FliN [Rhodospirillales bacterium]MDP6773231.1 flagellar motor switch protein FliN [Rhodospirillales bacterium]
MAEEDDAVEEQAEEPSDAEAAEAAAFAAAAEEPSDAEAAEAAAFAAAAEDTGDAAAAGPAPDLPQRNPNQKEAVYDIPVKVSTVLGESAVRVSRLMKLGRGAVIVLDRKLGEPIDLYVNDRLVARGELTVSEGRLGVTMTEVIRGNIKPGAS